VSEDARALRAAAAASLTTGVSVEAAALVPPAQNTQPDVVPFVLLEFEFSRTTRPSDLGVSTDLRDLAIGFETIEVLCSTCHNPTTSWSFRLGEPSRPSLLYGFSIAEAWGTWAVGPRCALVLELNVPPEGLKLHVRHSTPFVTAARPLSAIVTINKTVRKHIQIIADSFDLDVSQSFDWCELESVYPTDSPIRPRFSFIIVSHQRDDLLFTCIANIILAQKHGAFEIIVVDNGRDTPGHLDRFQLPARVITLDDPVSFGTANNIAAECAKGEFIVLINNDAFATNSVFDTLASAFDDAEVAAAGPSLLYPDGSVQELGSFVGIDGSIAARIDSQRFTEIPEICQVDFVSAACLMIRRDDFFDVGGFDPKFEPAYYEDVDFCLRLAARGKKTVHVKNALVYHIRNATSSSAKFGNALGRWIRRNRETFRARWGGWLASRQHALADPTHRTGPVHRDALSILANTAATASVALLVDGPLTADGRCFGPIAAASAMAGAAPTFIGFNNRCSRLDLATVAAEFGLGSSNLSLIDAAEADFEFETCIVSSSAVPTSAPGRGRFEILHCPQPVLRDGADAAELRGKLGGLLNFDAIVTDSEVGKAACLRLIADLGAPPMRIETIPLPGEPIPGPAGAKENLVLSFGPIRPGPNGGGHERILSAVRSLRERMPEENWRLVVAGGLSPDDDPAYVDNLRSRDRTLLTHVLVNPSRDQLRELLQEAKVYACLAGLSAEGQAAIGEASYLGAVTCAAVSANCVPLVSDQGVPAEYCRRMNAGLLCSEDGDVESLLILAADEAQRRGARAVNDICANAYSFARYQESWRRLVADIAGDTAAPAAGRHSAAKGPPALLVCGMHRSGTSAAARLLSLAGAELPINLMPPAPDNPAGFWEPLDVTQLNDRILAEAGSGWDQVEPLTFGASPDQLGAAALENVRRIVAENYSGRRTIVLKDPRISLLTSLWIKGLEQSGYRPICVILVRSPWEVAASLAARNGIGQLQGISLWTKYMLAAEHGTRGRERIFVTYDDLLESPMAMLDRIDAIVGQPLPKRKRAIAGIASLDPTLRHHLPAQTDDLSSDYCAVAEIYDHLRSRKLSGEHLERAAAAASDWLARTYAKPGPV
jgi:GT2 family glycosyltransferase/glycosyltransferase involved in cell wall biosynthesis